MITIQLSDKVYTGFLEVEITNDIETLCGDFNFTATTLDGGSFPISRGESCKIIVDGVTVLTGFVDKISVNYSSKNHRIQVSGRDRTQDIVDSQIDGTVEFATPISLENIITKVLGTIGYSNFKIINQVENLEPFNRDEMVSGMIGETAFSFLDSYCSKRQVLLTTDGAGNIVITRGVGIESGAILLNRINGTQNNIIEADVEYDDSKRFYSYIIKSQPNTAALAQTNTSLPASQLASIKGSSLDDGTRTSRLMVINEAKITNINDAVNRAQWERDIRRARAIKYVATISGHSIIGTNQIWRPKLLVNVSDDFCGVKSKLIIRKVTYIVSLEYGNIVKLDLVPRDTFVLLSEEAKKKEKKRKGKKGTFLTESQINDVLFKNG